MHQANGIHQEQKGKDIAYLKEKTKANVAAN